MNRWTTKWSPYWFALLRIAGALIFMQHGAEKLWGFAGGRIDHNYPSLHAIAGPIELVGGVLIAMGLFTRIAAFILCGEMAVAYFMSWAPNGFFPVNNGGEEAVLFCFFFLWLVTSGAGPWSLDALVEKGGRSGEAGTPQKLAPQRKAAASCGALKKRLSAWEPQARSITRIILAFVFALHGPRLLYGMFPQIARRPGGVAVPLDLFPQFTGYVAIVVGGFLLLGLLTRTAAVVLALQSLAAYLWIAAPRAAAPIRAGGNEVLMYFFIFVYFAAAGGGIWSLDYLVQSVAKSERSSQLGGAPEIPQA